MFLLFSSRHNTTPKVFCLTFGVHIIREVLFYFFPLPTGEGLGERLLLVRILFVSLKFRGQCRHDGLVTLVHCMFYILRSLSYWGDGLMDGEVERMPVGEVPVARAGHHVDASVDS